MYYSSKRLVIQAKAMPISVRLPPRVEQQFADYCVSHKVTRSEAVKRALLQMIEQSSGKAGAYELGKGFIGVEKSRGDTARHSKRLLRERFRNKTSLG
jgi:metal-responsive CopG/Arc/MetJ family transcriptional regulator